MQANYPIQPRDLVLAVISICGSRSEFGRTSLQKVTFLASLKLGIDLGHRAYYYGPYSGTVEADAEALVFSGLAKESVEYLDFVNSSGFQATRYHYVTSEAGAARVEKLKQAHPDQLGQVEDLVEELINVIGSLDQKILSAAAKTLYIAREQGKPVTVEEIKAFAKELGWNLSTSRIGRVAQMLGRLKFVEVKAWADD